MASRGTSGTVHVCRTTRCLQRCSKEGVLLSLHSFLSSMVCSIWLLEGLVSVRRLRVMPFPFVTEDIRLVGMWKSVVDVGEVIIASHGGPLGGGRITAAADDVGSENSHLVHGWMYGVTGGAQSRLCTLGVGEVCRAFGVRDAAHGVCKNECQRLDETRQGGKKRASGRVSRDGDEEFYPVSTGRNESRGIQFQAVDGKYSLVQG